MQWQCTHAINNDKSRHATMASQMVRMTKMMTTKMMIMMMMMMMMVMTTLVKNAGVTWKRPCASNSLRRSGRCGIKLLCCRWQGEVGYNTSTCMTPPLRRTFVNEFSMFYDEIHNTTLLQTPGRTWALQVGLSVPSISTNKQRKYALFFLLWQILQQKCHNP